MTENIPDFFATIDFSKHNHLQIGRIGEYWTKLVLSLHGFDIYTSEVDDKGIDFIVRLDDHRHMDLQVKTIRLDRTSYVFITKEGAWVKLKDNLFLALVCIDYGLPPHLYLIPAIAWTHQNDLFRNRDYEKDGQKSKPEWGLNISKKNRGLLEEFRIDKQIIKIKISEPEMKTQLIINSNKQ